MKISSMQASAIRKTVVAVLIMGLVMSQIPPAMAIVLNCDQIILSQKDDGSFDTSKLTATQKTLYDGGKFTPVSTYAPLIKARFEEVAKAKKEIYLSTHPNDEAFCPELDDPSFGKCPEIEGYTDANTQKVEGFYSKYRDEFATKIEGTFQNKASNSSLVNVAIMLFDEYAKKQDMLCGIFHYYLFNNIESTFSDETLKCQDSTQANKNARYGECKDALDSAVDTANSLMLSHIKSTAAEKKATLLVEKYKAINKKLIDLNNSMARMYAFFQTFANKLLFKADKQMIGM